MVSLATLAGHGTSLRKQNVDLGHSFRSSSGEITMTNEEFKLLTDLVYGICGLSFELGQKLIFEKRLKNRLKEKKFRTFKEYYHFLKYDKNRDEEVKNVINVLTVNETYFFREIDQLNVFLDVIVPEVKERKNNGDVIKIWSAGCSNGAEPYTLAMLIDNCRSIHREKCNIRIYGTDIDSEMLEIAKKGVYQESALRVMEEEYREKYFESEGNDFYVLSENIRSMVEFGCLNLFDESQMNLMRGMDIIFSRNVLIYFDDEGKKKIVNKFYENLNEGGYLFIGVSESLFKITNTFSLKPTEGVLLYEKREG